MGVQVAVSLQENRYRRLANLKPRIQAMCDWRRQKGVDKEATNQVHDLRNLLKARHARFCLPLCLLTCSVRFRTTTAKPSNVTRLTLTRVHDTAQEISPLGPRLSL